MSPFIFPLILKTWNRMGEDLESDRIQVEAYWIETPGEGRLMPTCYLVGSPHMYNKLGLQREAPPPPPRTLAQQRSPNSRRSIVMSASSASPTLCAWVLSTCNQAHLAQWASSKLKLSPPNHRRRR